jgi:predicted NUDIX family NTP pyrophosphohydrolase
MKRSAGLLVWRRGGVSVEVLLVHPSGAYNAKAPWGIPKGLIDEGETEAQAARRETREETGIDLPPPYVDLGSIDYTKSKKRIFAFAVQAPEGLVPKCASWEIDRAEMLPIEKALSIIHPDQRAFLERLARHLLGQ